MKEKTFEELIDDMFGHVFYRPAFIKLLQQVREATITECANIAFWEHSSTVEIHKQIINLETDRISIEP